MDLVERSGTVEVDDQRIIEITAGHRDVEICVERLLAQHGAGSVVDQLQHLLAIGVGDLEQCIERSARRSGVIDVGRKLRAHVYAVGKAGELSLVELEAAIAGGSVGRNRNRLARGVRTIEVEVDGLPREGTDGFLALGRYY